MKDRVSGKALTSRIDLGVPAIEAFGNGGIVAAAQQAALSLMKKDIFLPWLDEIAPVWKKHLKDHEQNIHPGD